MGFDNECILNIQSLPGEYFCPVCRTLVYPNEALQSQCTHLYCKPCLAYVVATTRACPYDGYLVTEADSKPLLELNKSLAETIGKVAVRCLYYRSGCQWQGELSDCITHCAECSFGNSAVICNKCGTQIMHRQVQEHGQTCPGMQQAENQDPSKVQGQAVAPDQSAAAPSSTASAAPTTVSSAAPATSTAATAPPSLTVAAAPAGQVQIQGNAVAYPQAAVQTPTADQWYQQQQLQYQQYYQQYPGYDPYQQQYQQYAQYQQQAPPQYAQQQMQVMPQLAVQGQQQHPQYVMPHPQVQPQAQPQLQAQPQPLVQPQPHQMQHQLRPQAQPLPQLQPQLQAHQHQLQPQVQPQLQAQAVPHPLSQPQVTQPHSQHQYPPQSQPQPQVMAPGQPQSHAPPPAQVRPQHPQALPLPPQQHPQAQMQHPQSHPQQQPHQHPYPVPQPQQAPTYQQGHSVAHPQPFPQHQPQHPPVQAVSGHQPYQHPQPGQQFLPGAPQQRPMQVPQHPIQGPNQYSLQQSSQMRPPHTQLPVQPSAAPPQGPHVTMGSTQQGHHPQQGYPGMQLHAQPHGTHGQLHPGQNQQMHPQQPLNTQGQPYMQNQAPVQPHLQQNSQSALRPGTVQLPPAPVQQNQPARPDGQSASAAPQAGSQANTSVTEQPKQTESAVSEMPKSEVDSKSEDNREANAVEATEETKSHKDSDPGSVEQVEGSKQSKQDGSLDAGAEGLVNLKVADGNQGLQNGADPSGKPARDESLNSEKLADDTDSQGPKNSLYDLHKPPTGSIPGQSSYPVQHSSIGQSPVMRPPPPDRNALQPVANQERRLPPPPPNHQMQVFGPPPTSNQMGLPNRNIHEAFPHQGQPSVAQEPFRPLGKTPFGPYPSEVPHFAGPDIPPSAGMAPGPHGHQHSYMPPPPHAYGPANFQGPPSGPAGSAFVMENQMGRSHAPALSQHVPFGQPHGVHPSPMPMNGIPTKGAHGLLNERFGPVPEETYRPLQREERLVPSTIDVKRFEEDMKRFPRPDHLDREGRPPYDGYMSSSRAMDIAPQPFGPDSRQLPPRRTGGPFPPTSGMSANPIDFGDRLRPHEDFGRKHDPVRNPGGDPWPGKFGSGSRSYFDGPGPVRNDFDTEMPLGRLGHVEPLGHGFPNNFRSGEPNGFGGIHQMRGDPSGPGSRLGFPSDTKTHNPFSLHGGMDSFESSRMRKPGSFGLCRICKIDCETVEGLDLHSQTREHQKMTMNMVLSIKQENAKRQKLNLDGNVSFEDANRMRKPSFEGHMNWT